MTYLHLAWKFRRLIGLALVAILVAWLWLSRAALERDLAVARSEIVKLENSVDSQNAAIDEMVRLAADREKRVAVMLAEARKTSATHYRKAQTILLERPVASDDCVSSLELLKEYQR